MRTLLIGHGYIGSYLESQLRASGLDLVVCDQDERRAQSVHAGVHARYQDLSTEFLATFDTILWFAGHSSVPMSIADPEGAFANNCVDLLALARRKRRETRLIYASSASVYSTPLGSGGDDVSPQDETQTRLNPTNPYDATKLAFDALAGCYAENVTGVRLGTVSGFSPRLRRELVFNAMNLSAMREGRVRLANGRASRAILFLDDLAHYVLAMISHPGPLPQIVNLASYNVCFEELASEIAGHYDVPIELLPDGPTYSFRVNWNLARTLFGDRPERDLCTRCREFTNDVESVEEGKACVK